jgi:hypothetical protein
MEPGAADGVTARRQWRLQMITRYRIGQCLLALAVIATPAFQLSIDWYYLGRYHVFSDEWPPHAKYHLLVYHWTLLLFSIAASFVCVGRWGGNQRAALVTLLAVAGFWLPYYLAGLFPFASLYAAPNEPIPGQLVMGAALFCVAFVGWLLTWPPTQQGGDAKRL